MTAKPPSEPAVDINHPLDTFSNCHSGILRQLNFFAGLPQLAIAAEKSRHVAAATLALFDDAVINHHADEEKELFPAVLRSATPGEEAARVEAIVNRLVAEHRLIESMWRRLHPAVKAVAASKDTSLDTGEVERLVRAYAEHAIYEEKEFLPLAQDILGRDGNHMAALGLSLHLRHAPAVVGYI